jgi:hypothetical protein
MRLFAQLEGVRRRPVFSALTTVEAGRIRTHHFLFRATFPLTNNCMEDARTGVAKRCRTLLRDNDREYAAKTRLEGRKCSRAFRKLQF